ncbi:hypothetical protein DFH29DRAFT_989447 [Suillus ampliporus]|nr:hypothetical protein DFH29DRAFT_989447 [Suillus ampliporus]
MEKDVFQTFYATKLSKRLFYGISTSDESEVRMISKLNELCGFEYTNKLQRMFTAKTLLTEFNERMQNHDDTNITFSIMVLGTNFWPLRAPDSNFTTKHTGRKLIWLWNYSKNELRTNYFDQKYILMTSFYQMAVLLQYNTHDTLSLEELVTETAISKDILLQVLAPLVKAKVLINEETDQYDLDPSMSPLRHISRDANAEMSNFKSKKIRVFLNQPVKAEVKAESSEATIVRIMKARKMMKDQPLIQEVTCHISQRKFGPDIPDIKVIGTLLELEYIERVDGGLPDTFGMHMFVFPISKLRNV